MGTSGDVTSDSGGSRPPLSPNLLTARLRPYLVLVLLWAAYFHPLLLHPGQVLYSDYSDFLSEHLPAKLLLNREWRAAGELPLWNPYLFCGTPLVHDIQVGAFYPPHAVTYLVPESAVGAAISWVIALHVLAAGVFTYLYARSHGLGEIGSLVAAVGFMLSAKWMTHLLLAGHTITVGLAWLPLVLLGAERAIRSGRAWPAIGAGVALALMVLGTHPQWAFYAAAFAAVWTLGAAGWSRRGLVRWLGCWVGAVAVALPLVAVQLLPTLEAAGFSARRVGLKSTESLVLGLPSLVALVGPSVAYDPPATWEIRGLFGVFWLAAALAAPRLAGGRAKYHTGVLVGLIVFSVGGAVLVEWLPGFRLFRIPSRMLLIAVFPLAFLAGTATDALVRSGWSVPARRLLGRFAVGVGLFAALPSLVSAAAAFRSAPDQPVWDLFVAYWVVVAAAVPVVVWLAVGGRGSPALRTGCWAVVLLAELVVPTITFPEVRPQEAIYPQSATVQFLAGHVEPGEWRVMDRDTGAAIGERLAVLGIGSPEALVYRLETPRGYNPLDVRHYREFVGYVVGIDAPVRGLDPVAQPILPNFEITNRGLFDLLNVRYVVCPADYPIESGPWRHVTDDPAPPLVPAIPPIPPPHLPPHVVYENPSARPRAFVVPEAAAMPAGRELAALTAHDLTRTVLLTTDDPVPPAAAGSVGTARIVEYRPNRVAVELTAGAGGFLVLSDVWFPGWVCRVDGREVPVYRANHAFRAVALPAGARAAVFSFEPRSYRVGWWVSAIAAGVLVVVVSPRLAGGLRGAKTPGKPGAK